MRSIDDGWDAGPPCSSRDVLRPRIADEMNLSNNEANHETNHALNHETNHTLNHETNHELNHETNHELNHETNHILNHETNHTLNHEMNREILEHIAHDHDYGCLMDFSESNCEIDQGSVFDANDSVLRSIQHDHTYANSCRKRKQVYSENDDNDVLFTIDIINNRNVLLEQNKIRKRVARSIENDEQRNNRQLINANRQRRIMENETAEERRDRQRRNLNSQKRIIQNETDEERRDRQRRNLNSQRRAIENETEGERRLRQTRNSVNQRQTRQRVCEILKETYKSAQTHHDIEAHRLGPMNNVCKHCDALHFKDERVTTMKDSYYDCCAHGKVKLDVMPEYPNDLKELFITDYPAKRNFYDNIRKVNSSVAFASMNPLRHRYPTNSRGPYCFRIHGQIHHKMNTALHPNIGDNASYGQLFIIEANEASDIRTHTNPKVDSDVLQKVENFIRKYNPYAQAYVMMKDEEEQQKRDAEMRGEEPPQVKLIFTQNLNLDQRRYNLPRQNEVAAVYVPDAEGLPPQAHIVIHQHGKNLQTIPNVNPDHEALIYPLFFPLAFKGWHPNLKSDNMLKTNRISRSQYYCNLFAVRKGTFNPIHYGRKLFQQYVVDAAVKVESDRLNWIKQHQSKIKSDNYNSIATWMRDRAAETGKTIGTHIFLPSTHPGSPRNMQENYLDAMAVVTQICKGKCDLFITMTCNPQWLDILTNIYPEQTASDRPDITARVFDLMKDKLIDTLVKDEVFGKIKAYIFVIEFQKRGLPHMHLMVTLEDEDRLRCAEDIDKFISSEIPDETADPYLYQLVSKHMMHGPCGDDNPNSVCMRNGKCTKQFPKQFQAETLINEDGYPMYKRPNNGRKVTKYDGVELDNRYVVPYSPYLLKMFNCHLNVEHVHSIRAIKYIYKYMYKGPDKIEMELLDELNIDEVKQHIDMRYVSPPDAYWKISGKEMHRKNYAVVKLHVHEENQQSVTFGENATEEKIQEIMNKNTTLMAYFQLNDKNMIGYNGKQEKRARDLFYFEIPQYFTFDNNKNFKRREGKYNTIGKMQSVPPSQPERFHLRILLSNVKGATNFNDLKMVEGVTHQTYQDACLARGLIRDDSEWIKCLEEGITYQTPAALRYLFATILIYNNPTAPNELWDRFKLDLSEDYMRNMNEEQATNYAYVRIEEIMIEQGKSLTEYANMPPIPVINDAVNTNATDTLMELAKAEEMYDKMNAAQKQIIDEILGVIDNGGINEQVNCYFVDGPGGSGKTFTYNTLCHFLKSKNKKVCSMAFTGIASTLLMEGRTLHNRFLLPVPIYSDSNSSVKPNTIAGQEIADTDVFIIDEAPMTPKYAYEIMNRKLQELMNNSILFGGKLMLLGGDFRQTLPIQDHATPAQLIDLCIKRCDLWHYFTQFELTQNMRAEQDQIEFAKFLLDLGEGKLNDVDEKFVVPDTIITNEPLEEVIFKNAISNKEYDALSHSAVLAPLNDMVNELNERILTMFDEERKTFTAINTAKTHQGDEPDADLCPPELLALDSSDLPPHNLVLCKNATVMLIRNLNVKKGLCNGTRMRVISMRNNVLQCKILTGDKAGDIVLIPRITISSSKNSYYVLYRHQYPLKLAFSMTINKSQGQTFQRIGIDLRTQCFNHGQMYVAFSRVKSMSSISVKLHPDNVDRKIKNPVYREVLFDN